MANTYILRKNQKLDLSDATAFDPDDTWMLKIASLASTAGSGFPLSATKTFAAGFYADDNGAAISSATFARVGVFRHLLTYTAGNREQEAAGVVGQLVSKQGTNRHNMCGVMGSYEVNTSLTVDGQIASTDPWIQAAVIGRVGAGNGITTINTYGVLAGMAAMSNTTSFAANNGMFTGFYVGKWASTVDWTYGLYIDPLAVTTAISVGSKANTAGSGVILTGDDMGAVRVFSDDNGASVGASVRGLQSRTLLTFDQTGGTIRAAQGQLKLLNNIDVTSGIYTAVQGYVEMAGTHSAKTGSTFSAIDSSTEITTALTVDSGGEFYGIHVETTGAGTITNNGTCAGIGVTKASGAASWPVGIQINCDSVVRGIQVGTLGSNITSGVPMANATSINGFYSDDNGADQTTGTVWRNVTARTYFSIDQTAAAADYYVLRGHLKAASGVDFGGDTSVKAAVNGYSEFAGATIIGAGSFFASVLGEFWGDGNITGTGKAAGVMARLYTSTGTTSGTTAAFMATKHFASTQNWPYGLYIDSATCDIRLANASGAGIYSRATSPNGALTAPKGSLCLVPNGSGAADRLWINTDSGTTWTSVTCGA